MGQANRKKQQQAPDLDRDAFAAALHQVITAVSESHGADCLLYASVGAAFLRQMGFRAEQAAGSAVWRVGAGDGDVISHAPEISNTAYMPASASQAGMFHAWIEVDAIGGEPSQIVDLTTWQLARKASALDAADGGCTSVEWCPRYLWAPRKSSVSLREATQAPGPGVYAYLRKPAVEKVVFAEKTDPVMVAAAVHAYRCIAMGIPGVVIGLGGEEGPQVGSADPEAEPPAPTLDNLRKVRLR